MSRLKAVLFDWAGTTVDHGSRAPVDAFVALFARHDVPITPAEARGPMGTAKRDHIAALLGQTRIRNAWTDRHKRQPTEADLEQLYREFLPLQKGVLADGCRVIDGVIEVVAECRRRGLRIGTTTGYTREVIELVERAAAEQGFFADATICADDVSAGRPAPWMNFRVAEMLGVYPLCETVIVDDTLVGIEAGINASAWTVAVCRTGNAMGLSEMEVAELPLQERNDRVQRISEQFLAGGADFAIPSVADLPQVLDAIASRS